MWFEMNIDGIIIKLRIKNYTPTNKENWDSEWCQCDFLFSSGDWLFYHKEDDELLLCSEIDDLESNFTELLDNKISKVIEIPCIEPDFIFILYPDICLKWRIYFWDGGEITNNYLTLTLDRDEIIRLRDYLVSVKSQ